MPYDVTYSIWMIHDQSIKDMHGLAADGISYRSAARFLRTLHVHFMRRRLMEAGCEWDEHLRRSTVCAAALGVHSSSLS